MMLCVFIELVQHEKMQSNSRTWISLTLIPDWEFKPFCPQKMASTYQPKLADLDKMLHVFVILLFNSHLSVFVCATHHGTLKQ